MNEIKPETGINTESEDLRGEIAGLKEQLRITTKNYDEYHNALCKIGELVGQETFYSWQRVYQNVEALTKRLSELEIELKPCPFCAGEARYDTNMDKTRFFVYCTVCETITSAKSRKDTARNFWNHRVAGKTNVAPQSETVLKNI